MYSYRRSRWDLNPLKKEEKKYEHWKTKKTSVMEY